MLGSTHIHDGRGADLSLFIEARQPSDAAQCHNGQLGLEHKGTRVRSTPYRPDVGDRDGAPYQVRLTQLIRRCQLAQAPYLRCNLDKAGAGEGRGVHPAMLQRVRAQGFESTVLFQQALEFRKAVSSYVDDTDQGR